MNDVLNSESCSGCESGWTLYLEHSVLSPYHSHRGDELIGAGGAFPEKKMSKDDGEEEDLSMISDASSGPPHFHEGDDYGKDNGGCCCNASIDGPTLPKSRGKKQRVKEHGQEQRSLLDDTASSPFFNFSNGNFTLSNSQASMDHICLDFSLGYSTTHFGERSAFHDPFGFFQSSLSGKQVKRSQWLEGKR